MNNRQHMTLAASEFERTRLQMEVDRLEKVAIELSTAIAVRFSETFPSHAYTGPLDAISLFSALVIFDRSQQKAAACEIAELRAEKARIEQEREQARKQALETKQLREVIVNKYSKFFEHIDCIGLVEAIEIMAAEIEILRRELSAARSAETGADFISNEAAAARVSVNATIDAAIKKFHEEPSATETGQRLGAILDYGSAYNRDVTLLLAEIDRQQIAIAEIGFEREQFRARIAELEGKAGHE